MIPRRQVFIQTCVEYAGVVAGRRVQQCCLDRTSMPEQQSTESELNTRVTGLEDEQATLIKEHFVGTSNKIIDPSESEELVS